MSDVNWGEATLINHGGYGVIYRVAPSVVAKVAPRIDAREIAAQLYFSAKQMALPIFSYSQGLFLTPRIHRQCCGPHGVRELFDEGCTCNDPVDVVLMPEAERVCLYSEEVAAFMDEVTEACVNEINRAWDCRLENVARYQGRLVALDFGLSS
jgi:hypothetical protein